MEMQYNPDGYAFPQASGYEASMMYSEAQFSYNSRGSPVDGELHLPSSRFSNSSAPSASSSPEGSPLPNAGQLSFIPDYHHNTMGVNPSIVGHPDYYTGTEYSFTAPGMEEFNMAYESKPGFVGESEQLLDTNTIPVSPSGLTSSGLALDTDAAQSTSPPTAASWRTRSAPEPSASSGSFPCALNRVPRSDSIPDSIPVAGDAGSPTSAPKTPRVSFFSQSSGHFVAPLGSSCWSPLVSLNRPVLSRG